jgi:hypothetical protein
MPLLGSSYLADRLASWWLSWGSDEEKRSEGDKRRLKERRERKVNVVIGDKRREEGWSR